MVAAGKDYGMRVNGTVRCIGIFVVRVRVIMLKVTRERAPAAW